MSNYRDQLEKYLEYLDVKAERVIDVGGAALPVRERVKSWDVKDYIILDNGTEKSDIGSWAYDLNRSDHEVSPEPADVVFCLEVFEYIHDPHQAMVNLAYLTEPNGTLYITFPFLYPIHEPKQADSLRYTAHGLARILGEAGFGIDDMIPRVMTPAGFDLYKQFLKAEGMHASKHSRHDILGWIVKATKGA